MALIEHVNLQIAPNQQGMSKKRSVSAKGGLKGIGITILGTVAFFGVKIGYEKIVSHIKGEERKKEKAEDIKNEIEIIKARSQAKIDEAHAKALDDIERRRAIAELRGELKSLESEDIEEEGEQTFEIHDPYYYTDGDFKIDPMIGNIVPENQDAILYGKKGTLKSYLTINTLAQMALGEKPSILSRIEQEQYETPANVYSIYINGENGPATMKKRLKPFGANLNGHFLVIGKDELGASISKIFTVVRACCINKPSGTKIVVGIDNIKSFLNGFSQKEVKDYLNVWRKLRSELTSKGITLTTVTVCHTEKKGEKISGTYDIECLTPYTIRIDEQDWDYSTMTIVNQRDGDLAGQIRRLRIDRKAYKHHVFESLVNGTEHQNTQLEDDMRKEKFKTRIVELHTNEKKSYREIADILKGEGIQISHATVSNICKEMAALQGALKPAFA